MRLTAFRGRRSTAQRQAGCGTRQRCVCTSFPTTSSDPTYQRDACVPPTDMGGSSHYGGATTLVHTKLIPWQCLHLSEPWGLLCWLHGKPEVASYSRQSSARDRNCGNALEMLVSIGEILECIHLPNSKSTAITQGAWTWLSWEYIHSRNGQALQIRALPLSQS